MAAGSPGLREHVHGMWFGHDGREDWTGGKAGCWLASGRDREDGEGGELWEERGGRGRAGQDSQAGWPAIPESAQGALPLPLAAGHLGSALGTEPQPAAAETGGPWGGPRVPSPDQPATGITAKGSAPVPPHPRTGGAHCPSPPGSEVHLNLKTSRRGLGCGSGVWVGKDGDPGQRHRAPTTCGGQQPRTARRWPQRTAGLGASECSPGAPRASVWGR